MSGRRRRGGRSLPAAVNRRGHPQLLGKEAVEMGCVVHTDAFRDLLAGKDAAVQQEAGVFQPFQVQIFYGGGSHVFAENAGQIGMADMEGVRQLSD